MLKITSTYISPCVCYTFRTSEMERQSYAPKALSADAQEAGQMNCSGVWEVEEDVPETEVGLTLHGIDDPKERAALQAEILTIQELEETVQEAEAMQMSRATAQAYLETLECSWAKVLPAWMRAGGAKTGADTLSTVYRSRMALKKILQERVKSGATEAVKIQLVEIPEKERVPTFDGQFHKWAAFRDSFTAEIHENSGLTKRQKLLKLRGSVADAAKRAMDQYTVISDENYDAAWAALQQQYENKHLTIRAHLREMESLPPMDKRDSEKVRLLIDTVAVNRRHLLSLYSTEQLFDFLLIRVFVEPRMDSTSRQQWETTRMGDQLPSWSELSSFLMKRASYMDTFGSSTSSPGQRHAAVDAKSGSCGYCRVERHRLSKCRNFLALARADRWQVVDQLRYCQQCLQHKHTGRQCAEVRCQGCSSTKHHWTLCSRTKGPREERRRR